MCRMRFSDGLGGHRWLEKEILWFCFRRAEPERMISGWTASSRDRVV